MPSAFIRAVRSYPALPLARQLAHQGYVPPNPLVLGRNPRKSPAPTTDRDRPVSRRSKPSSRTAFIGEQPNPWELLHPQDAMSRHRGAKPPRRCERSGEILGLLLLAALAHFRAPALSGGRVISASALHVAVQHGLSHHPGRGLGAPRSVSEAPYGAALLSEVLGLVA